MKAIEALLADLIDYAGLYPPASLDMHTAVRNYLEYSRSAHAPALGRFIVDLDRFPYLWDAAGDYVRGMRLSVLASFSADWDDLRRLLDKGYRIEAVETRADTAGKIGSVVLKIPPGLTTYFEIPIAAGVDVFDAVLAARAHVDARIKVRMGGVAAEAIPSTQSIAYMLEGIARRRLLFKATAGLHHPVRGRHALTSSVGSETAVMHGFVNLACAAALLYFGGDAEDACRVLEEEWPGEWKVSDNAILWQEYGWSGDELGEVRRNFFTAFGSCSFDEPMRDLEALAWL
jgi:hypothetical protein